MAERQSETTNFFISYAQVDRPWAEWIAWKLEAAGYTTVIQAWDFRPGHSFVQEMDAATKTAQRTIAVLSPDYFQSRFTPAEWQTAFRRDPNGAQRLLVPVRVRACDVEGLLGGIVYIDLVDVDENAARERLLAGVQRERAKPTRAPRFPEPSHRSVKTPPLFPSSSPPALKTYLIQTQSGDEWFRRNRHKMLENVRHTWIEGLLEPSLSDLARIDLGLEPKPDAVDRPFDLFVQRPKQRAHPLPPGTPISQIFDDARNALLILGEPGSGKTTLLLELARDLLDRAEQDERHRIPVVFNLSSWAEYRLALADWLVDELNKRYDVSRKLAQAWIDADVILPLLDGLDEVAAEHRKTCVRTINDFVRAHGLPPLVVCSRTADYEKLAVRLRVPTAVCIQALRWPRVQQYVEQAGAALEGLRTILYNDPILRELLNTPLMLSIAALAYKGRSAEDIHAGGTIEEHRKHVFAAYTEKMFDRRAQASPYTREQTKRWLAWLARAMKAHNQRYRLNNMGHS